MNLNDVNEISYDASIKKDVAEMKKEAFSLLIAMTDEQIKILITSIATR